MTFSCKKKSVKMAVLLLIFFPQSVLKSKGDNRQVDYPKEQKPVGQCWPVEDQG